MFMGDSRIPTDFEHAETHGYVYFHIQMTLMMKKPTWGPTKTMQLE